MLQTPKFHGSPFRLFPLEQDDDGDDLRQTCEQAIAAARLEIDPTVGLCIRCAEAREGC